MIKVAKGLGSVRCYKLFLVLTKYTTWFHWI